MAPFLPGHVGKPPCVVSGALFSMAVSQIATASELPGAWVQIRHSTGRACSEVTFYVIFAMQPSPVFAVLERVAQHSRALRLGIGGAL